MKCTQCGAAVSDPAFKNCPYCGTILPHEVKAAEDAAKARALLAEDADGDGVPDALAPLMAAQKAQQERDEARERQRSERSARMLELESTKSQLATLRASGNLGCAGIGGGVIAIIAAIVWTVVTVLALATDPWMGLHARVFCPMVCDGCHAPYTILTWRSTSGRDVSDHMSAFCRNPRVDLDRLDRNALLSRRDELAQWELPGGLFTFIATMAPVFALLVLPYAYVRARRGRREGLVQLEERVARLEAALRE